MVRRLEDGSSSVGTFDSKRDYSDLANDGYGSLVLKERFK